MDINRVNSVLDRAIVVFQESEIDSIFEAQSKAKKITVASVKRELGKVKFEPKGDGKSFRYVEPSPGVRVYELRTEMEGRKRPLVDYYLKIHKGWGWHTTKNTSYLKQVVKQANEYADEAAEAVDR